MLLKPIIAAFALELLSLVTSQTIEPGRYGIHPVESPNYLQSYTKYAPVFVLGSQEPYGEWDITFSPDNNYIFQSVYSGGFIRVLAAQGNGLLVNDTASEFSIEEVGSGDYMVKIPDQELYWTVTPHFAEPLDTILLNPINGAQSQHFNFTRL